MRSALAAVLGAVDAATSLARHDMVDIRYWIQVFELIVKMNVAVVFVCWKGFNYLEDVEKARSS